MSIRALVFDEHGDPSFMEFPEGMTELGDEIRRVLGGWMEGIGPGFGRGLRGWHAYCDEEGKIKGLPVNEPATRLAHTLGWPSGDLLCGPVAFFGDHPDGDENPVPQVVIDEARRMGILIG